MERQSKKRVYIAIDLKSFYASAECVSRGLDPLETNLVVADRSRTEKTICLAVSPPLKSFGISGRARLFEVIRSVREINALRRLHAPGHRMTGSSVFAGELSRNPSLELDFVTAQPRMSYYIQVSTEIYGIYLKYIAPEDMHVYSIDEVFMDVTGYLKMYGMTAHELAMTMIRDVLRTTGITATAGIGPNLYLAKVAMDIKAKKMTADRDGVRIAELDEIRYRQELWDHCPITDFWRIGRGTAKRLASRGMYTMGDVALCSSGCLYGKRGEEMLYRMFGVNAELLIDHAWGWEPCTITDIKRHRPSSHSTGSSQVLPRAYSVREAKVIVREMCDQLSLELVRKHLVTEHLSLYIGYEKEAVRSRPACEEPFGSGKSNSRRSGRAVNGRISLGRYTSSARQMTEAGIRLYDQLADPDRKIRRIGISADSVLPESHQSLNEGIQMDLFCCMEQEGSGVSAHRNEEAQNREKKVQKAMLELRKRYHKNAVFRGMDLLEGATTLERNRQIGGHRS